MPDREYCFDARTGFYTVDKPAGWAWGPAELDPENYVIVRSASPELAEALPALRIRRKKLVDIQNLSSGQDNIFLDAVLGDCPESEWIEVDTWTVLRTGSKHYSEDELMGSVQDGDNVVLAKAGAGDGRLFFAIYIVSVASNDVKIKQCRSFDEAVNFLERGGFAEPPAPIVIEPPPPPPVEPPVEPEPTVDPAYTEDPPVPVPEPPPFEPPADGIYRA